MYLVEVTFWADGERLSTQYIGQSNGAPWNLKNNALACRREEIARLISARDFDDASIVAVGSAVHIGYAPHTVFGPCHHELRIVRVNDENE